MPPTGPRSNLFDSGPHTSCVAVTPPATTDTHTECSILGPGGTVSNYPTNLTVAKEETVIVGIATHEDREQPYTVVVRTDTTLTTRTTTVADAPIGLFGGEKPPKQQK